jgi:cysteinyl-tRNA synthetase
MDDDFNSARALGLVFELVRDVHRHQSEAGFGSQVPRIAAVTARELLAGIGIQVAEGAAAEIPDQARKLLERRNAARQAKRWEEADACRNEIQQLGFVIEDRPTGSVLKKA